MHEIFKKGDPVLFYMDYFKYSDDDKVLTQSDADLFNEPAQLGVVVESGPIMKIRIPDQPVEVVFDVPERYIRKPRISSWFADLGGSYGSVYVYLMLLGILVFV